MKKVIYFLNNHKPLFIFILFFVILLIGSWLRLGGVISNSFAFTYDVGRDLLAVEQMVLYHKFSLIGPTSGLEGVFYGPWWYIILSLPFFISGGNPQMIALFMNLAGISMIFLAFLLGKKIEGNFLGIVFASLVSFSPAIIGFSFQIWNPDLIPFFLFILLILIYRLCQKKSHKIYFLILGLLFGLIINLEIIFGVLLLLSFLILFVASKLKKSNLIFVILGFFPIMLPHLLFDLRHNFLMTKSIISFLSSGNNSFGQEFLLERFLNRITIFFNLFRDTVGNGNNIISILTLFFVICVVVILYKYFNNIEKIFLKISLVVIVTFFLVLLLFPHAVWSYYLIGLPIFYILLLSIIINVFRKKMGRSILPVILFFFILMINLDPIKVLSNFTTPLWEGNSAVYRNQVAAIDYVYKNANGKNFNYAVYTPVVYDYTYQYLFSWYGKNKYGYTPKQSKERLFFLIIEPDSQYPFRLKNWLEIRKNDGKVLKEEIVKGEIKVQTKVH